MQREPMTPGFLPRQDRFRVVDVLGRGYSGVVYLVHDQELETTLALKALETRDPEKLYRLKQEFRILADIRHTNLVELYELISAGEDCAFTMEYVDGVDLVSHVRQAAAGPALLQRLLGAASQLAEGVAAIHAAGRLHRDLKPSNVLVAREGGRLVLLDFGFAVVLREDDWNQRATTAMAGTVAYMAPEVLVGAQPSVASDWYGVGVMLFEALSGRLPFEDARALLKRATSPPPSIAAIVPDLPPSVDVLVRRLLDPNPETRGGAADALELLGDVGFTPARQPGVATSLSTPFVGRNQERARLQEVYAAVVSGQAAAVRVLGPSGVGKTELVRRFLTEIAAMADVVVLSGRCHPQETLPYRAFDGLIDSLSRFLDALPDAVVQTLVPRHAGALVQQFPVLARVPAFSAVPPTDAAEPRETRHRSFGALRELLGRIAECHHLVLWIDDLQWGDEDSAELVAEIFRAPDPPSLLLVASCRSEESEQSLVLSKLANACDRPDEPSSAHMYELVVEPLSAADTRQLVLEIGGAEDDVESIVQGCRGSPFLITQLALHLQTTDPASEIGRGEASIGLTAFLDGRVQQLPPSARQLIETVSVAGRPIDRSLALEAAGLEERARPLARNLERERFLRSALLGGRPTIELYHDKIRQAALARIDPKHRAQIHRRLAEGLSRRDSPDPEALYTHFLGAGDKAHAAQWAVRAGERAAATLAFADAARLFAEALQLIAWEPLDRAKLLMQTADALVNAGRGADAAPLYLDASTLASGGDAIDLRRRAGEQFLLTGQIDRGVEVVRGLLAEIGVAYPQNAASGFGRTIIALVRLAIRGLKVDERRTPPSQLETLAIDSCHSSAKGMAMVDPFLGLYFALTMLLRAQALGDRRRFAIALAGVGATLSPAGGLLQRWAGSMFDRASVLAGEVGDAYLRGYFSITAAQRSMVEAKWREMLDLCDAGNEILRAECRGIAWELGIGSMAAMRALEELGDIAEMRRRASQMLRESESSSNLYGTVTALLMLAVADMLQGQTTEARSRAQRAVTLWTLSGFHVQHFYALRVEVYCDLLEGRATEAWKRIDTAWPLIRAAGLLRHTLLRTDTYLLRARAALVAAQSSADPSRLLDVAAADARRLNDEKRPDAIAAAALLRAGIGYRRGDRAAALDLLDQSERAFRGAEMSLVALASRWQRSAISPASPELDPQDAAYLKTQGISAPQTLFAVLAPGFPTNATLDLSGLAGPIHQH